MNKARSTGDQQRLSDRKLALAICWGVIFVLGLLLASTVYFTKSGGGRQAHELPAFIEVLQPSGDVLMVGKTEVTVAQWRLCERDQACPLRSEGQVKSHPMVAMSWTDISRFIAWSADRQGLPLRVPSKAEWQLLAAEQSVHKRAPLFTDPRLSWAADYDLEALPQSRITRPAGSFGANSLEIEDIKGNVWEWVAACYYPQPGLSIDDIGCLNGRIAMGAREVGLSELLRTPGNTGCSGGQPPANVGFRLVYTPTE